MSTESLREQGGVQYDTVQLSVGRECETALAVEFSGGAGGALIIFRSDGEVEYSAEYDDISLYGAAGNNRVAFSYQAAHGSGVQVFKFAVVCGFEAKVWWECLEIERKSRVLLSPRVPDNSPSVEYETDAHITIASDTVRVRRTARWGPEVGEQQQVRWTEKDLGTETYILP